MKTRLVKTSFAFCIGADIAVALGPSLLLQPFEKLIPSGICSGIRKDSGRNSPMGSPPAFEN